MAALLFVGAAGAQDIDLGAPPTLTPTWEGPGPDLDSEGNILLLVADDLGIDRLGFYGQASAPPTPNLDRLASEGVLFLNAWSQPTCSPTRATLQTGRHGFRTSIGIVVSTFSGGSGLPFEEMTLPEMLDLGTGGRYAHAAIGKWHLGTDQVGGYLAPNLAGYSHFAGSIEGQLPSFTSWTKVINGNAQHVSRYATSEAVDDALAWIQGQSKPWLCSVAFQAPHAPFHRPPDHLHTRSLPAGSPRPWCGAADGLDPLPFYEAMVEALDTEIGRLLAGIPPLEREKTTVIFLGDNGTDTCIAGTSRAKGSLYEGGVHVPFLVSGAGVEQPGTSQALVSTSDVFATVAELAGVDLAAILPEHDSVSLVPLLADPTSPSVRRWLYAEIFTPNGPGNPEPAPPCPTAVLCQTDLGFAGPGRAALSICGQPLYGVQGSNVVPVRLDGAPPGAQATLFIGNFAPTFSPDLGAWMVSNPPSASLSFVTNAAGGLSASVWTGSTSRELHYQFVVEDATQPLGYAVSNAVRIEPLWTDMQAARTLRYKLIRFHPCREEFYDLLLDPAESTNLLAAPLTPRAQRIYDWLADGMEFTR